MTYSYDGYGRIASIENPFGETTSLTYDSAGRVSTKTFHDGQYETFGYDARSRLISVVLKDSAHSTLLSQSYTWNAASEVVEHIVGTLVTEYEYDDAGRLTKEEKSSGYLATYTYDANGNRLTRTVNSATDYYSYDDADKLLEITGAGGTRTYAYDSSGRTSSITTSSNVRTFTYTDDSRIASISDNSVGVGSYSYGGFGTRTSKTENLVTNTFIRDGMGVTAPVLRDSNASYTAGVSERRSGDTTYWHSGLKNVEAQSDANETISAAQSYDAFGNLISSSGTWNGPFGYAGAFGYQQDATGYKLLGHRYYDPDTGRFLARDQAKHAVNWWVYCKNAPIKLVDPNGLKYHDPTVVHVNPGFQGLVEVTGETAIDPVNWTTIRIPGGYQSNPSMDVDYVTITDESGSKREILLLGAVSHSAHYEITSDGRVIRRDDLEVGGGKRIKYIMIPLPMTSGLSVDVPIVYGIKPPVPAAPPYDFRSFENLPSETPLAEGGPDGWRERIENGRTRKWMPRDAGPRLSQGF